MKKARIIEIIILVVLVSVSIGGGLLYRHIVYEKPNTYNIVFKDIDSIVNGSPVRFMGINVGYVVKLKRKDKAIICRIKITKKGVKIPDGTKAKVAFNGLGGSKSVELFPPESDNTEIHGIVSEESLRINDFVNVIHELKDVCIIINNFIQNIDPIALSSGLKEVTNPENIERIDKDMQRITDGYEKSSGAIKGAVKKEGAFIDVIDWFNNLFK